MYIINDIQNNYPPNCNLFLVGHKVNILPCTMSDTILSNGSPALLLASHKYLPSCVLNVGLKTKVPFSDFCIMLYGSSPDSRSPK